MLFEGKFSGLNGKQVYGKTVLMVGSLHSACLTSIMRTNVMIGEVNGLTHQGSNEPLFSPNMQQ